MIRERRKIVRLTEAQRILTPYYDTMVDAIQKGFNAYLNYVSLAQIEFEPRTKANIIHDYIVKQLQKSFAQQQDAYASKWNGIFAIKISESLFIRFNKFNKSYQPSITFTKQTKAYFNQVSIEGLPERPTLLFAGYKLDEEWESIQNIFITCWEGEKLLWVEDILNRRSSMQLSLFDLPETKNVKPLAISRKFSYHSWKRLHHKDLTLF